MRKSMIDCIVERNIFLINSDNYRSIESRMHGYAITDGEILINVQPDCKKLPLEAAGLWANIYEEDGNLIIQQNLYCGFGLFVFRKGNYWAVSNSLLHLINNLKDDYTLHVNEEYVGDFIARWLCTESVCETIITEINELSSGQYLRISLQTGILEILKEECKIRPIPILSEAGVNLIENWRQRYETLARAFIANGYAVSADLSGGFDTRCMFPVIAPVVTECDKVFVNSQKDDLHTHVEDFAIATAISEIMGFKINSPIALPAGISLSTRDSLLLTAYAKMWFHEEFYYAGSVTVTPIFKFTGGGGEHRRPYLTGSAQEYIANIKECAYGNIDFAKLRRRFVEREMKYVLSNYPADIDDAANFYVHARDKNHMQRSFAESFLSNCIAIAPLLDPMLLCLDMTRKGMPQPQTFIALVYDRYLPELNDVPFDGGRVIKEETWQLVKEFNKAHPCEKDKPKEPQSFRIHVNADYAGKAHLASRTKAEARKYMVELYNTREVRDFISMRYNYELYKYGMQHYKKTSYFPERFITKLNSLYILNRILDSAGLLPELAPQYISTGNVAAFVKNLTTARVDFFNYGSQDNDVRALSTNDPNLKYQHPEWLKNQHGSGLCVQTTHCPFELNVAVLGSGRLDIIFRAIDARDANNRRMLYKIDYEKIEIFSSTRNEILAEQSRAWDISHDHPFIFHFDCADGEEIRVRFRFKAHDYASNDFALLCALHRQAW